MRRPRCSTVAALVSALVPMVGIAWRSYGSVLVGLPMRSSDAPGDDVAPRDTTVERLLQSGDIEEARRLLRAALQRRPDDVEALTNLGRCHVALGELAEAMTSFERAIRNDAGGSYHGTWALDSFGKIARHLAAMQEAADDADGALRLLERALTVAPSDDATLNLWAQTVQRAAAAPSHNEGGGRADANTDADAGALHSELLEMPSVIRVAVAPNRQWQGQTLASGARALAQLLALHGVRLEWSTYGAIERRPTASTDLVLVSPARPRLLPMLGGLFASRQPHVYFSGEPTDHANDGPHSNFVSLASTLTHATDPTAAASGHQTARASLPFSSLQHIYVPFFTSSPYYRPQPRQYDNIDRPFALSYCASNRVPHREDFFDAAVRAFDGDVVHALGKAHGRFPERMRRIGGFWEDDQLVDALSQYRFHMAFENSDVDGYITEKITLALAAGCTFAGSSNPVCPVTSFLRCLASLIDSREP